MRYEEEDTCHMRYEEEDTCHMRYEVCLLHSSRK